MDLLSLLTALDLTHRPDEQTARERMCDLLRDNPACFQRTSFPAHFTAGGLVVDADASRLLLHHHRKLDRWLQFGGHCDGDSNIHRVARREALEESGIHGLILASERPFDLDIHQIPAHGSDPLHFHYDVRFMFIAPESASPVISEESLALRWFTPGELTALPLDESLLRMIRKWQVIVARRSH